ncbi:CHAPERONE-LIKE PROTEIN OF POR1 [Nymphaea thermarum]|nr:CHAPERONE-LIKE PROTEIN OF POR1 [Nymphaea thermarum]
MSEAPTKSLCQPPPYPHQLSGTSRDISLLLLRLLTLLFIFFHSPIPSPRKYWCGSKWSYHVRKTHKVRSTMDASFGDMAGESTEIFPRINVKDPYKRLGISREATEEEIQAARNFLISKYAGHKPSVDAIESAHDKIIMQSFLERKSPKLNIKKKMREVSQTRVVKAITSRFEMPSMNIVIKTAAAFAILGALTVLYPTEEGPTLQVAISLVAAIYFIYQRLRSRIRAVLYGLGVFFGSWLLGTFLMVSVIPPLLKGPRSLEVTTSLITYVFLWVSSSYLK